MDKNCTPIQLPEEVEESITSEELLLQFHAGDASVHDIIQMYGNHIFRGATGSIKPFSGEFDVSEFRINYGKDFFPSAIARRSYLYLQTLTDTLFGPSYFTKRENIQSYLLTQTTSGAGYLSYQGKEYKIQPGDVFLIDCRKFHDYRAVSPKGWGYRMAHFDGYSMPDFYTQILSGGSIAFQFTDDSHFSRLFKELYQVNRSNSPDCEFLTHCILTQMIAEIMKTLPHFGNAVLPDQIKSMCEWLTEHCCERLSLKDIALQFNQSKYHMSREFKRRVGKTIFDFICEARLNMVKNLLRYTDLSVSTIVEHTGFDDHSNFSRLFRRLEGLTPTAYRRQWQRL